MKLVTYSPKTGAADARTHAGLLWGQWVLDIGQLSATAKALGIKSKTPIGRSPNPSPTVLDLLARGPSIIEYLQDLSWRVFNRLRPNSRGGTGLTRLEESRLYAPIPRPPNLRDFYSFEAHVKSARARRGLEMVPEWYEIPAFYYSNPNVIHGPDEPVRMPTYTKMMDYELEIACVIGKPGRDIAKKDAETHIAGYTILNDWSARDIQVKEMRIGLGPAKAKDFATSLGPWLVTPDELVDKRTSDGKYDLEMRGEINGRLVSKGNMQSMHWTFADMISYASQSVELQVGDVFGSGTVGGGSLLEQQSKKPRWLKSGDEVELSIERLGSLRNRVIGPDQGPKQEEKKGRIRG